MKIKMLPNWCKKLGLFVFFSSIIINSTYVESREAFYKGWNEGRNGNSSESHKSLLNDSKLSEIKSLKIEPLMFEKTFGTNSLHYVDVLILFGMIIYMMSKEKIEDDYINILRLESYQLTVLLGLFITFFKSSKMYQTVVYTYKTSVRLLPKNVNL